MKKIICAMFFLLLLCSSNSFSEDLEGFMGVPWGSSKSEFTKAVVANGGKLEPTRSRDDVLMFANVKFAGVTANAIIVDFFDDKLCRAMVFKEPKNDFEVIDRYHTWKKKIAGKYGKPTNEFEYFKSPYEKGDGYEIQAIRNGKGVFSSYWFFGKNGTGDSINLEVSTGLYIMITYEDSEIYSELLERRKLEHQKDL